MRIRIWWNTIIITFSIFVFHFVGATNFHWFNALKWNSIQHSAVKFECFCHWNGSEQQEEERKRFISSISNKTVLSIDKAPNSIHSISHLWKMYSIISHSFPFTISTFYPFYEMIFIVVEKEISLLVVRWKMSFCIDSYWVNWHFRFDQFLKICSQRHWLKWNWCHRCVA